jgi:dienelactone hydrolase
VIVLAEMPGITPEVVAFADRVVDLGCTAVLPHLFGVPGAEMTALTTVRAIGPACVSREFSAWATGKTSPVVEWCKALARHEHERCGGPGVGVVGMCFTGNFALAMLPDESVIAPVMSQPSLPLGFSAKAKRGLYLSDDDLASVQGRMEADPELCVLGLRFSHDRFVPRERFEHLREALGDRFVAVEIDSSKGNPHGNPPSAHSVLTVHLVDEPGHPTRAALDQVLDLFRTKLLAA